jgi:hypothetical protein
MTRFDNDLRSEIQEELDFAKPVRPVTKLAPVDNYLYGSWEALGAGAPVLVALAQLTSEALLRPRKLSIDQLYACLSNESKAILFVARTRGMIEIKGSHTAFEAPARMLSVYVDLDDHKCYSFRDSSSPEVTVRFLEAFRDLCSLGLVLHHSHRDFSLTPNGFQVARLIDRETIETWLAMGQESSLHE